MNNVPFNLQVCNYGTTTVSLAGAVVKFWYSEDGAPGDQVVEEWNSSTLLASKGAVELALNAFREGVGGVSTDCVATFTLASTVTVAAAVGTTPTCTSSSLNVQIHSGTNWDNGYLPLNDWSYLGTTTFADNVHVTLDMGASRLWGTEPALL